MKTDSTVTAYNYELVIFTFPSHKLRHLNEVRCLKFFPDTAVSLQLLSRGNCTKLRITADTQIGRGWAKTRR